MNTSKSISFGALTCSSQTDTGMGGKLDLIAFAELLELWGKYLGAR